LGLSFFFVKSNRCFCEVQPDCNETGSGSGEEAAKTLVKLTDDAGGEASKVAATQRVKVYSIHRFVVSDSPGSLGLHIRDSQGSLVIDKVDPGSVGDHLGVKKGDDIAHPSEAESLGTLRDKFVRAMQYRPLMFEVRRPHYLNKSDSNKKTAALHRFVIRKKGKFGVKLRETHKRPCCVSKVLPGSLAEFYGLKQGDLLAKPDTGGQVSNFSYLA